MKRILVAIDGSRAADKALDVALDLAELHGAEIRLLHVLLRDKEPEELLRLPDLARAGEDPVGELTCLAQRPRKVRSAIEMMSNPTAPDRPIPVRVLRKIGAYLLKRGSLCAESRCLRAEALKLADGPVAQRIIETAIAEQADAIAMGSRGLCLIDALGLGSASQEVFRTAPCTCIAVH